MPVYHNPFDCTDSDRAEMWEVLVRMDIQSFVRRDWNSARDAFIEHEFLGIDAQGSVNPARWTLAFPSLQSYADSWRRQAHASTVGVEANALERALVALTSLGPIHIAGDRAVAYKRFDGVVPDANGAESRVRWQTLYHLRRDSGRWRITGFVGYLPLLAEEDPTDALDREYACIPAR